MRITLAKVALITVFLISSVALVSAPVLADGGEPFQPNDGRVNPMTGDKIAVYANPTSIDVLGIDGENQGAYLTTFSWAEITSTQTATHTTSLGTVTLKLLQAPQTQVAQVTINGVTKDQVFFIQNAMYTVSWTGGPFGADGSAPFTKTFGWGYNFTLPTSSSQTAG